jgi:hypothetical protein
VLVLSLFQFHNFFLKSNFVFFWFLISLKKFFLKIILPINENEKCLDMNKAKLTSNINILSIYAKQVDLHLFFTALTN